MSDNGIKKILEAIAELKVRIEPIADQEKRIRAIERNMWLAVGAFVVASGAQGAALLSLMGKSLGN